MTDKYKPDDSRLFSALTIKNTCLKNRFMRSAMAAAMADPAGFITGDLLNFYRIAAEGGAGLIITGAVSVHPNGKFFNQQIVVHDDSYIPGLKSLADTIHRHGEGVLVWPQLHCGAAQHWEDASGHRNPGLDVSNLGEDHIYTIIDAFGDAALRAKKAGFDGVQLHGAHRYLISQFLSPATNSRSDKWGGTPEKRMRLVLEIYENIRNKVGNSFPVGIKMNTADYFHGGNWVEDTAVYAERFSQVGFDLIEMSGGLFYITELREELRKKAGAKEAYFRDAIPRFRQAIGGNTVLAIAGGIRTPAVMEEILDEGVDLISMARPFLAEPNLPRRIYEGDIRASKCISTYSLCNLCRTKVLRGSVTCVSYFPGDCFQNCPLGQDVPRIHTLVAQNKYEEALGLVKKDNPLANIMSRVCHSPCEKVCRGEDGEPLAIKAIKRFITNYGMQNKLHGGAVKKTRQDGEKVAIIGSGPAGLTCAYYLAQMGYNPALFEKEDCLGGMLNYIPAYRLPKSCIDLDLHYILSAGVEVICSTEVGKDLSLQDLFAQGFKAVFIAAGASVPNLLSLEGGNRQEVLGGLDFLKETRQGGISAAGKRIAVIGGGNTAIDVARSALRLGAREIEVYYRRNQASMPAIREEVEQAFNEGVIFEYLTVPLKVSKGNGGLKITFCKTSLEVAEESEKEKVIPVYGTEFIKTFDYLVLATGQRGSLHKVDQCLELEKATWGEPKKPFQPIKTNISGVFAGGDLVSGAGTVVDAAGAGKKAASYINDYLQGSSFREKENDNLFITATRNNAFSEPGEIIDPENPKRVEIPYISVNNRIKSFDEVVCTLDEESAVYEAKRCLKYDLDLVEKTRAKMARMGRDTFVLEPEDNNYSE